MGLTKNSGGLFYNLKIYDQITPKVEFVEKVDGEWEVTDSGDGFDGRLVDIKVDTYTYKKEEKYKLTLHFIDHDGVREQLSCNFNSLTLNILNTLANEDQLTGVDLSIRVYSTKDKKGEDRPRIYMEINGNKGEWFLTPKQVSKIYDDHEKWVKLFKDKIEPKIDPLSFSNTPVENTPDSVEEEEAPKKKAEKQEPLDKVDEDEADSDLPWDM